MNRVKGTRRVHQSLIYVLLLVAMGWTLFPVWWAFVLSVKHPLDFFTAKWLPFVQFEPTLDHWRYEWQAFDDPAGMGRSLMGSLIVAAASSVTSLALGALTAYGLLLHRRQRRSLRPFIPLFLLPRVIPPAIIALPFAAIMRGVGLEDTYLALVIAHATLALPLAVLLLYSALLDVPDEVLDAARVDGCGALQVLRFIVVPLIFPVLLATGALCFALSWNEFVFALMNVQQRVQTVPLVVASLLNKDGVEFEYVGSHLLMTILPPVLLALLARRYIVRGLSLGIVKDS